LGKGIDIEGAISFITVKREEGEEEESGIGE